MKRRWLFVGVGLFLMVFGYFCQNYTKAEGLEHHQRVAAEHGLPPPGPGIFHLGQVALLGGGVLAGFALGRRSV